jgi:hypothetical protein
VATNIASVNTVAGDIAAVGAVAGNSANVNTVAGISSNVTAVAGIDANVTTVAGIAANVTTVAGNNANVTTVANINAAVSAVAAINTEIEIAAANVADITNFADVYQGPKSSDPTARNDTSALQIGDLYFNTIANALKVYDGAAWQLGITDVSGLVAKSGDTMTGALVLDGPGQLRGQSDAADSLTLIGGESDTNNRIQIRGTNHPSTPNVMTLDLNGNEVFRWGSEGQLAPNGGTNYGSVGQVLSSGGNSSAAYWLSLSSAGLFRKADPTIVAWSKTGAFTISTATTLYIEVNGTVHTIASSTAVTMPGSATTGTDYAIWAKTDGTLEATSNHTSPPAANARKVGGFHYAPGGNATAQSGGNTTAQINEYSFWDLKWRPTAPDPRGMTLVAGGFWSDIYLTGVDAITNGSSKYNVTIGDGSSPPKVPTMFGGNGTTTYGSYTWFQAMELATAFGKKCPTQMEFMSLAYGTTEASSIGTDQVSTILNASYTSKWGVIQSSGCMWVWTRDRAGPFAAASWNANTGGRGSEYNAPNAGLLGGSWADGSNAGSRCSAWSNAASASPTYIGSRFVCDHLQLD